MTLTESEAREVAKDLLAVRRDECARLDLIRDYVRGNVVRIFLPKKHSAEYKQLVAMSLINIMPLVVGTFAQNLFIEGYRTGRASSNAKAWEQWQANRMDLHQSALFRTALEYGLAYTTVLPAKEIDGKKMSETRLYSPRMLTAVYDDPVTDEWPVYGLAVRLGYDKDARKHVRRLVLLDDRYAIEMTAELQTDDIDDRLEVKEHGLGVTPIVRWQSIGGDLDDQSRGEVEPLMPNQDSLNNTTFGLKSTERAQAFAQRWATGLEEELDETGNPVEPFRGGADRVWTNTSPDARFGQFEAADLKGYLDSRQSTLRITTAQAQMAPHTLMISDGVANLSAEALAALEAAEQRKLGEMKTALGESAEQHMRLSSKAAGDDAGWKERDAEARWRDTESRSLAQLADALGKMATMLGIPPRALWEELPNMTDQKLERWDKLYDAQAEKDAEQLAAMGAEGGDGAVEPAGAGAPA